jgi:hypothetical protein
MSAFAVTLDDGSTLTMAIDLDHSEAPILYSVDAADDEGFFPTPYQTADAGHSADRAAYLLAGYLAEGPDDGKVIAVTLM